MCLLISTVVWQILFRQILFRLLLLQLFCKFLYALNICLLTFVITSATSHEHLIFTFSGSVSVFLEIFLTSVQICFSLHQNLDYVVTVASLGIREVRIDVSCSLTKYLYLVSSCNGALVFIIYCKYCVDFYVIACSLHVK